MPTVLDKLLSAFKRQEVLRPAVFDRRDRELVGRWRLDLEVPVRDILDIFNQHGGYTVDGSKVLLPLHEKSTAELTGEFLVYRPDQLVPCVTFYDFQDDQMSRIPLEEFGRTYPAWRIRFWHPEFEPPTVPTYLETTDTSSSVLGASLEPASTGGDENLLEEVRLFVGRERDAARAARRDAFVSNTWDYFFDQFGGIPEMVPRGREVTRDGMQLCVLGLPDDADSVDIRDEYTLFDGVEVIIDAAEVRGFPVEAEIQNVESSTLEVTVNWTSSDNKSRAEQAFLADSRATFEVGELLNPVTFDRKVTATREIESQERKREILRGERSLEFEDSLDLEPHGDQLNNFQRQAVVHCLRARDVFCIHGPPGTGKTRTLVSLVRSAVRSGDRVLACAHSNQAVDNLLVGTSTPDDPDETSLHAAAQDGEFQLARAGSNSTNEVVKTHYEGEYYGADVVGATTSAASTFHENQFDLAVIDEATQATVASSLIPWTKAKTLVLAGDHKQLPPYTSSESDDDEDMRGSLFEHLLEEYGSDLAVTLARQYRMNHHIAAFPNRAFYDGELTHGQRNRDWSLDGFDALCGYHVSGTEEQTPFHSYYNEAEIEVVLHELDELLDSGVRAKDVGVITPYSGQIGKITAGIRQRFSDSVTEDVKVQTVDSFQGGEREAIVVSFVRSNDRGNAGFLTFPNEGPRRLNVALTRARKRCTLVGDWTTLSTVAPHRDEATSSANYYRALYRHLQDRGVLRNWSDQNPVTTT